jgi:hypothetical protein
MEMAFYFPFAGTVTHFRVQEQDTEGYADHRKLFVAVGTAVIDVKLVWDSVGGNRVFQNLLEVGGIVAVEQFTADEEPGMVIDDHDTVDPARFSIFRDVREIAGVRLPDLPEFIFLKCLAVTQVWISCGFEVIVADEALDGVHADSGRDKGITDEPFVDLGRIHAREVVF